MRIDGRWTLFDDGASRPVIWGEIRTGDGSWLKAPFLVDTGADRTVFSAPTLTGLGLAPIADINVLGCDITALFAVIVDQPDGLVSLLAQRHRYRISPHD